MNSNSIRSSIFVMSMALSLLVLPSTSHSSQKISNGVSCLKSKSTTKVGSKVYVCAKNPFLKTSKLTWTLRSCLRAENLRSDAIQQYESWKDLAKLAGAEGDAVLADLQKSITDLENTMKNEVCKRGA